MQLRWSSFLSFGYGQVLKMNMPFMPHKEIHSAILSVSFNLKRTNGFEHIFMFYVTGTTLIWTTNCFECFMQNEYIYAVLHCCCTLHHLLIMGAHNSLSTERTSGVAGISLSFDLPHAFDTALLLRHCICSFDVFCIFSQWRLLLLCWIYMHAACLSIWFVWRT